VVKECKKEKVRVWVKDTDKVVAEEEITDFNE
jgi:hypothetical protein